MKVVETLKNIVDNDIRNITAANIKAAAEAEAKAKSAEYTRGLERLGKELYAFCREKPNLRAAVTAQKILDSNQFIDEAGLESIFTGASVEASQQGNKADADYLNDMIDKIYDTEA